MTVALKLMGLGAFLSSFKAQYFVALRRKKGTGPQSCLITEVLIQKVYVYFTSCELFLMFLGVCGSKSCGILIFITVKMFGGGRSKVVPQQEIIFKVFVLFFS